LLLYSGFFSFVGFHARGGITILKQVGRDIKLREGSTTYNAEMGNRG